MPHSVFLQPIYFSLFLKEIILDTVPAVYPN